MLFPHPTPKSKLRVTVHVGQKGLSHHHGDVFIRKGGGLREGKFGLGYVAMEVLSLWLSKLHACWGWHAGSGPGEDSFSCTAHHQTKAGFIYAIQQSTFLGFDEVVF